MRAWEDRLSRFKPESELCALNNSAGTWLEVSEILFDVLSQALHAAAATDGLFDPTMLDALEHADTIARLSWSPISMTAFRRAAERLRPGQDRAACVVAWRQITEAREWTSAESARAGPRSTRPIGLPTSDHAWWTRAAIWLYEEQRPA